MGMIVQHNMNALNAYNKLNANVAGLKKSSEKLSSGYRINRAGDDAAGLAISEKMRSQIRGLNQAVRNSQDGINMIQTYEGAAQESHSILQRMKELADESANGTYQNEVDRDAIQLEFDQLNDELNQLADTDFNGVVALNGGVMADGTVVNNTNAVAGTPTINYTQNVDDNGSLVYSENVNGTIDSSQNGTIVVNGVRVTLTAGQTGTVDAGKFTQGAYEPDGKGEGSKYEVKTKATLGTAAQDWLTAEEVYKVGKDETQITINGHTFTIGRDNTGKITNLISTDGKDNDIMADDAKAKLYGFDAKLTYAEDTGKLTAKTTYSLGTDLSITNKNTSEVVGKLTVSTGVSTPDSFQHGSRNLTYTDNLTLQSGARSKDSVRFNFAYATNGIGNLHSDLNISARGLGTDQLSLATAEEANFAIDQIDNAINKVSMVRATFGAAQNRLEHKITNLTTNSENLQEAESAIRDTDMASEMMNYTKFNILQQAAQSMLAQANQQPQSILQLLG